MPLHEAVMETVATPPSETMEGMVDAQQIVEQAPMAPSPDEAASATTQGYEYTRQDGTVERAANAQEAIKLCPVLGKLALKDPDAANLLLEMSALGQAKMKEQPEKAERQEQPEPKKPERSDKHTAEPETTGHHQAEVAAPEPAESHAAKVVLAAVRKDLDQTLNVQQQATEPKPITEAKPLPEPVGHSERKPAGVIEPIARPVTERNAEESRHQEIAASQSVVVVQPEAVHLYEVEATEQVRRQQLEVQLQSEPVTPVQQQLERIEPLSDADSEVAAMVDAIFDTPESSFLEDEHNVAAMLPDALATPDAATLPASEHVASVIEGTPKQITWEDELEAEPMELYDDFVGALHTLIETATIPDNDGTPADVADLLVANELQDQAVEVRPMLEPVPAITVVVAERLDGYTADEKAEVAPTLQAIMTTVQVVQALETGLATEPEVIQTVTAQLEEQIVVLFEQLGIEYEAEDVEQFMRVLLQPDFQPPQTEVTESEEVDLEQDGTHEAKQHFVQAVSDGIADAEHDAERLLGRLTLLHTPLYKRHRQLAFA